MNNKCRLAVTFLLIATWVGAVPAQADPVQLVFTTAASPLLPGSLNQGWWSDRTPRFPSNDNYLVASRVGPEDFRNFFIFDISGVTGNPVSATLEIPQRVPAHQVGNPYLSGGVYGLFDVTSDLAVVKTTGGLNPAIFADLGTGVSYGSFNVAPWTDGVLRFALNDAALSAIRQGGLLGFGGAIVSPNGGLFAGSHGSIVRLVVDTDPAPVPEPGTLLLLGSGLAAVAQAARRRKLRY